MSQTTFYIFNEDGIVTGHQLDSFCRKFAERTALNLEQLEKNDIDPISTVYKKYIAKTLEYTVFDHGYVMKVEGDIRQAIRLLMEVDAILDPGIVYFISPSQRVENSKESQFPRGATENEIAGFLDIQFRNNEYTNALTNSY